MSAQREEDFLSPVSASHFHTLVFFFSSFSVNVEGGIVILGATFGGFVPFYGRGVHMKG